MARKELTIGQDKKPGNGLFSPEKGPEDLKQLPVSNKVDLYHIRNSNRADASHPPD
jgi:hypothetical protein